MNGQVFLDTIDPVGGVRGGHRAGEGDDQDDEEEEIEVRGELLKLCEEFHSKRHGGSKPAVKWRPGQKQIKEFRADEVRVSIFVCLWLCKEFNSKMHEGMKPTVSLSCL